MRLKDINAGISFELWMKPVLSGETLNMGVGYITPNSDGRSYRLRMEGQQWSGCLRDVSIGKDLDFHLRRGCAHLAEVRQVAKDGSAFVRVVFFNGEIVEIGDVEIGIDERIERTARKNLIRFNGAKELGSVLTEKCKISVGVDDFFLLMSGPSARADFEVDSHEDKDSPESQAVVQEKYREFSIYGERVRIPVERRPIDESKDIYFATKAVFRENLKSEGSLRLARGSVQFSDYTKTGRIRALAAGAMSLLTKEPGSYLKQWDEYGAIEAEMLLKEAKSIGRIDYHRKEKTKRGIKFFVQSAPDQLAEGDMIEITSEEPLYIKNPGLTWEAYSKALEEEFASRKNHRKKDVYYAPILEHSKTSIELGTDTGPPLNSFDHMFLIKSISGYKTQIERRMRARSFILEGRCANPLLGLLIEEGGILPDIQHVTKLKPLTSFVKKKIFKHRPTDRQVEAIDVALNTPDIALIQGPPGTGKTTVITAILERLNEELDKTKSIKGQILVSGYQHDAVENIVARLSVNNLPAIKFGRKSADSEFSGDIVTDKINEFCSEVSEEIRNKNPQIDQTKDQKILAKLFVVYSSCPSRNNTVNLMERILDLPRNIISQDVVNEAKKIIDSLQAELEPNDPSTLRLVRALRVRKSAFEDDGVDRAADLLAKIEDESVSSDLNVLENAVRWSNGQPLSFLPEIKRLKESLLIKYLPSPDFRIDKPREDVLKLVATVSQILEKNLHSTNKRDAVLAEFLHELEDNPDGVRNAIEDYSLVYAATTQQAEGRKIKLSKNKNVPYDPLAGMVKYDTVIIDEAARASPRDLLIPMAQAEKRIILVGDHRQLPHLIDWQIAKALEDDGSSGPPFVKESMFEYLFENRLKKLEENDGIKRTVTLDAQYRTHPLLGNFVSANFYRKHNEDFRSPLSENHFVQGLQGIENKAAIWIDVPNSQGPEEDEKPSRKRVSEAYAIADYVRKWIDSEEGSVLSFGVISFYKAQVNAVCKALQKFGITEQAQGGAWEICQEYRIFKKGGKRLRIGTVDAFQGMEFDIVFLSMVRSHDMNALPPHIYNEEDYKKKQRKLFGHLMSENRLCVSMSRQKKVLAVVGNGDFVSSQIAEDAVPALKHFYELCYKQGVIL